MRAHAVQKCRQQPGSGERGQHLSPYLTASLQSGRRPLEWLRELNHAIDLGIPPLRSVFISVEITARRHFVTAVGECEQPAPRNAMLRSGMVSGQAGHVDERRTPMPLDVRLPAVGVIGVGVRVAVPVRLARIPRHACVLPADLSKLSFEHLSGAAVADGLA